MCGSCVMTLNWEGGWDRLYIYIQVARYLGGREKVGGTIVEFENFEMYLGKEQYLGRTSTST